MSKRFGRNQRREMRDEISSLKHRIEAQGRNMARMYSQQDNLRSALEQARHDMRKIGWTEECDAIRNINEALKRTPHA